MESPKATTDSGLQKAISQHRRIMTSFRPLPDISEEDQEHLISLAMEATGLKKYQRWDAVEYTIIDSIRNGWQLLLQKARKSLTGKSPSPDAEPSSSDETQTRTGGATAIAHKKPEENVTEEEEEEEEEEGWTVLH